MMFDNFQAYDVQETRRVSREEGRIEGKIEGEQLLLIKLVIKKLEKNYSAEQIAEILEESLDTIQPIYDIALRQAPDYNTDKVFEELNSNKQLSPVSFYKDQILNNFPFWGTAKNVLQTGVDPTTKKRRYISKIPNLKCTFSFIILKSSLIF